MNHQDVLAAAQRLQQQGQACALVSVLRVQAPASAQPGDKAVVTADGVVHGWVGGGCAQPAVLRTVRSALQDGVARVIRIAPAEAGSVRALDDVLEFGMACHSGGTLELFIDPLLPQPRLTVVGDSPVAVALAGLAPRVGLAVTVLAQGADPSRFPDAEQVLASDDAPPAWQPGSFVVVATQGRRDLPGLRTALALQARQVFFVASARKAQVLKAQLLESGCDAAAVQAIVAPAGQAIGAQTPAEIALAVLAAVVAARRGAGADAAARSAPAPASASASASAAALAPAAPAAVSPASAPAAVSTTTAPAAVSTASAPAPGPVPRPALPPLPPLPGGTGGSCCGGGA